MKILKTPERKLHFSYILGLILVLWIFSTIYKNKANRDYEKIGGYKVQISELKAKNQILDSLFWDFRDRNLQLLDSIKIKNSIIDSLESNKISVNYNYEKKLKEIDAADATDHAIGILRTIDGLKKR